MHMPTKNEIEATSLAALTATFSFWQLTQGSDGSLKLHVLMCEDAGVYWEFALRQKESFAEFALRVIESCEDDAFVIKKLKLRASYCRPETRERILPAIARRQERLDSGGGHSPIVH